MATWPLSVCVSYAMNTPSVGQEREGKANKSQPGMPRISTLQARRDFNSKAKGNSFNLVMLNLFQETWYFICIFLRSQHWDSRCNEIFLVEDKDQLISTTYPIPLLLMIWQCKEQGIRNNNLVILKYFGFSYRRAKTRYENFRYICTMIIITFPSIICWRIGFY